MRLLLFLFLIFLIPIAFAQTEIPSSPIHPEVFYGKVITSCDLTGAKIQAYINNELRGEAEVKCDNRCYYGKPGLFEKQLIVTGYSSEVGNSIDFYVLYNNNKVKLNISRKFEPGKIYEMDINLNFLCSTTAPIGSGAGSTGGTAGGFMGAGFAGGVVSPLKTLEEEGIKETIENIIPLENIVKVEVKGESKGLKESIKYPEELENYNVKPLTYYMEAKVILIKTEDNKEKYFTKIEKTFGSNKPVVEYFPKEVAEDFSKIHIVKGKLLRVIEKDPILQVEPEDNKVVYLVEGDKIKYVDNILSFEEIKEKEKEKESKVEVEYETRKIENESEEEKVPTGFAVSRYVYPIAISLIVLAVILGIILRLRK